MKNTIPPTCIKKASELHRQTFRTSRLLDFLSEKELVAQIGHPRHAWPLVRVKSRFERLTTEAKAFSESVNVPSLNRSITEALTEDPTMPWDFVIAKLAAGTMDVS